MKFTPASVVSTGHIILTGPITGTVTCHDGTIVDVSPPFIEVPDADAAEVAHLIGLRYATEGHPDDREVDEDPDSDTYGQLVQRGFAYVAPTDYTPLEG